MSSSDSNSSSTDVKPSEINDNEQVVRQLCSKFRGMAADNERPSTSKEGNSTMMMVDGQGNEFHKVTKRKLDTDEKCDERPKRIRLKLANPPHVERNSDATDSTESGLGGDRVLEESTREVIQTTLFDDNETYKTTSAVRKTLHGTVYQWKHMMLVVHRAREKGYSFRFATEMDAAEKFDDAVLEYQDPVRGRVHRFLQFKHVSVDGMLKAHDLLTTAKKDPFGIVKYFNSWRKIRNNPIFNASKSKEFILCTNSGLDVVQLKAKRIKVKELEMDDLLKVTVGPKQTPRFYKFVDEPSILRDKLEKEAGASQAEVSEFLQEFILAVNQPNEIELGTMIKHELGASHQFNLLNVHFIGACFQNMMVHLLKKTGQHSEFLSHQEADAFFEELQRNLSSLITVGLKLSYSAELENCDINFEVENSDLRKFLDRSDPVRNSTLELTSPNPTLLTALRVYQTLKQIVTYNKKDSSIFIHLEKLLLPDITDQVLCAFGSSISHDLLVIDCGLFNHNEHTQTLWSRLREILDEIPCKKLILIIQKHDSSVFRKIRQERDDEISIIDLTECSRQKLLKKSVIKFQGHEEWTSFGEIFSIRDFDDVESNKLSALKKIIKTETLIQLIRGREIVIGSKIQGLGDVEKYYIPRTIVEHVVSEAVILKDSNIPDLFAISGIDQEALEKIVASGNENQLVDESSLEKLDIDKYHILQSGREADHFRNICEENSERNIHWLRGETGALVWQQSFGGITNLRAFGNTSMDIDNHKRPGVTGLTENQLAQHDGKRRIVILTDTAGMGKSTLLTNLAVKIKHDRSSLLVIKVDLPQRTGVLKQEKEKRTFGRDDTNGAVDFLVDVLSNLSNDFERNIFKYVVKLTGEAAVLIDGYDEICPDYGDIVIDLLGSLAKLSIRMLFVTTRPHTSDALERELGTFPHFLQRFSRANQTDFLTKFWGRKLNSNESDETIGENLEEHANAVLKILVKLMNPRMLNFTGIPLQLRMVAEAFPFEEKEKLDHFESSEEPIYITDLYRRFVDKKFDIFLKEKSSGDQTNLGQKKFRKVMYRSFLTKHQKLALEALFDAETVTALTGFQQRIDEMSSSSQDEEDEDEGEERSGIVTQVINGKPHFVHRTFAEYFAAAFLSKKLKDNCCDLRVRKFFVGELLVERRYEAIRAFLNCLLCRRDHAPEKDSWAFDLRENCDDAHRTLYHIAAKEHNTEIVRFFSIRLGINREHESPKQDPDINLEDSAHRPPLMDAVAKGVLALVECFVDGGADINPENYLNGSTALHWALWFHSGFDVVKYLVEKGAEINRKSDDGSTPLHAALTGRAELNVLKYLVGNGAVIDSRALRLALEKSAESNVVKYLVKNGAVIDSKFENGSTPLHAALEGRAELHVVKYIVENIVDINRESTNGLTALHCALRSGVELDVVKYLVKNGAEINRESKDGSTALHWALHGCGQLDIVRYLVENGVKIDRKSGDGSTPLHSALRGRTELDVVTYLVENGSQINSESNDGWTPLHLALYNDSLQMDVVQYLVEKGAEINHELKCGSTPLHSALHYRAALDVIKYLVEKGAEINHKAKDGSTVLHLALRRGAELDVVTYLVENGAEINCESKDGWTPLHLALSTDIAQFDVVQYLVEKGAEINRESEDGSTPLDLAFSDEFIQLDIVQYLVGKGSEINHESKDGSTALHYALRASAELNVVKYLVENGAEINRESRDGSTALHYALGGVADLNVAKYLVENGAEINRGSRDGLTALHYALQNRVRSKIIEYLVVNGAEINRKSEKGLTPLHTALEHRAELKVVKYLVKNGAEFNPESKDGLTALHYALRGGAELDVVKYLIENGAEINRESRDGSTALHYALQRCSRLDVIKYLVENGAEITRESEKGLTPLHTALEHRAELNVVKHLVKNGAVISHESKDGMTALHHALQRRSQLDAIKYLVENGAEINRESRDGSTALHYALQSGARSEIIEYLVKNGAGINRESKYGSGPLHSALEGGAALHTRRKIPCPEYCN